MKDDSASRAAREMSVDAVAHEMSAVVEGDDAARRAFAELLLHRASVVWHSFSSAMPPGPETVVAVMFFAASLVEGLETEDEKRLFAACRKAVLRVRELHDALGSAVPDGVPVMPRGQA
jgi:hypothetical protein